MASVSISIRRDNGVSIQGGADVPDELLVDIASMLGAMIFDAASPAAEAEADPPDATGTEGPAS